MELGQGMLLERGDDTGLDVRGGAQVEGDVTSAQLVEQRRVLDRGHAMGDAANPEVENVSHPVCARHLPGVRRQRQPGLAGGEEGDGVWRGGPGGLRPGQVEADEGFAERSGRPGELGVGCRRVRPHGRDDQADRRRRSGGRRAGYTAGHRLNDLPDREPSLEVQAGGPANLGIPDSVGGEVLDELGGGALEGVRGLEERDGQVEEGQQLGLVRAPARPDHPPGRFLDGQRHADRVGKLHRSRRSQRAVEVLVELSLRQAPDLVGVHPAMIGSRLLATACLVLLVVVLGASRPRPEVARAATAAVAAAADRTIAAVSRLRAELGSAVDAAREGSAGVVAGDEDPAEQMVVAAEAVVAARGAATDARDAAADLQRARSALDPESPPLPPAPDPGQLASIAGQLRDAGEAGARFADARRRAEGVAEDLVEALDAVAADEPDRAGEQLGLALVAVDGLREWEDDAPTLSVWIDTVDAMIHAVQRLVDSVRTNDAAKADAAQAAFDNAAAAAVEADRALRIGLGEAGSTLTAVPVGRLAEVLVALDELEREVRAVLVGARR